MRPHVAEWWLVTYEGSGHVMTADEFWAFADRVKYDGVVYEAQPLERVGDQL